VATRFGCYYYRYFFCSYSKSTSLDFGLPKSKSIFKLNSYSGIGGFLFCLYIFAGGFLGGAGSNGFTSFPKN
jgi:hypothetical protein